MSEQDNHKGFLENLRVDVIFVAMGFSAMVGQILLLRGMMSVFGGNELVVGAVFFGWVLWAGLGNLIASYLVDRVRRIPHLLSLALNLTALALPATVFIASLSKVLIGIAPAEIVGLPTVLVIAIVVMAPFCFLVGASLTIAAKLPATGYAEDIGVMYLFDALGAALGGIVATWFALRAFTAFQVAIMTALVLLFVNAAILVRKLSTQALTALIAIIAVAMLWFAPGIHAWTAAEKWKGYHPIVDIDSRYGNLVVTEQNEEHTLFADGVPQFSTPHPEAYETGAILPMLMHREPKDVLVIGGGLSGMLANWRQASFDSITYLQIDPDVTKLEKNAMTSPEAMAYEGLAIVHQDAPAYLANLTECADGCFDVIILKTGDPDTAGASRLLTRDFFKRIRRALRPEGVLAFGVFEPGNAIGPEATRLLGTVRATLGSVFDRIVLIPFDKYYFIASPSSDYLTDEPSLMQERLLERHIVAPVLEGQYISSIFPERIRSMKGVIDDAALTSPLNTNLRPFAYFAGLLLWASRTGGIALDFLTGAEAISWQWLAAILIVLAVASILVARRSAERLIHLSSFWMLFAVGFAAIVYEITLLIYYQLQHGMLFYQIGIIITAFMVGLSIGAYASIRIFKRARIRTAYLLIVLIAFAIYQPLLFTVSGISFVLANFLCGIMVGFLFEASAEWMVARHEEIGHTAGWLNCADYWGSAVGSVLASIIAIPLFGLVPALIIAATLPLTAALVVATSRLWK